MYSPGTHRRDADSNREGRRFIVGPDEQLVLAEPAEPVDHANRPQSGGKGQSGERKHEEKGDDANPFKGNA